MKGQSGSDDTPATAAGLRPEARLLVLSAGKPGRGDEAGEVGRLVGGVRDWDGLIDTAVRHGVASLLHALFDWSGTISGVPEPARERLKKIYYATVLRNEQIKGQLLDILRAFREAAIDTLLLKGLFVLGSLYEDSGQRPIGDIDLLLRSDDVTGGDKVMRKMGYSLRAGSMPLGFYRRVHFHVVYHRSHSRSQVPVELHWDVQDRFNVLRIDTDRIRVRAVRWALDGETVRVMGREDLLAYLCYHADKHAGFGRYVSDFEAFGIKAVLDNTQSAELIWYADVVRLLDAWGSGLDWDLLARSCLDWGIGREVHATLSIAGKIAALPSAAPDLAVFTPSRRVPVMAGVYRRLLAGRGGGQARTGLTERLGSALLGSQSWLQFRPVRFLDVFGYVFPSRDEVSTRYGCGAGRTWLAYAWHIPKAVSQLVLHAGTLVGYWLARRLRAGGTGGQASCRTT